MTKKPNIILIMADQMAPQLTGAYDHPVVKTPNLDILCEQGIRFDAAYSNSPICAPARAAMMTGRFVSEIGTYDNGVNFPADFPTWAHMLRLEGYEVIASGKMHYLGPDQLHGLEERLTQDVYPAGFKWVPDWQGYERSGIKNDKAYLAKPEEIGVRPWTNQLNYDEDAHYNALEFLRRKFYTRDEPKKELEKPFCLIISYTQPHSPYQITKKYWDLYEGEEIALPGVLENFKESEINMDKWLHDYEGLSEEQIKDEKHLKIMRRAYYGMISYIDEKVGEIIFELKRLGLKKDTAVIFTSDHGDMVGERGFVEKRAFYEYSSRIPMIWSFPNKWNKNAKIDEPVSLIDIFPTLADLVGSKYPLELDGESFLPLLEVEERDIPPNSNINIPKKRERVAISEYHCEGVKSPCFMIRKGTYKYIYVFEGDSQLFNLSTDPDELKNLSGKPETIEIENELKQALVDRFDFEKIKNDVIAKQKRCIYIHKAMIKGKKTMWDYKPEKDMRYKYDQ